MMKAWFSLELSWLPFDCRMRHVPKLSHYMFNRSSSYNPINYKEKWEVQHFGIEHLKCPTYADKSVYPCKPTTSWSKRHQLDWFLTGWACNPCNLSAFISLSMSYCFYCQVLLQFHCLLFQTDGPETPQCIPEASFCSSVWNPNE